QSKLVEWASLRAINFRQAQGASPQNLIDLLYRIPYARQSAILEEKLGDLYWANKKFTDAMGIYEDTLKLGGSPQERIRVMLKLGDRRRAFGPDRAAFDVYEKFTQEFPDYPDRLSIFQRLLPLAQKLGQKEMAERCQREIQRLSTASIPPKN